MTTSKTIAALLVPTLIASAASIFINPDAWPTMVDPTFHNLVLILVTMVRSGEGGAFQPVKDRHDLMGWD
jgi:hypothetical protein